MFSVVTLLTPHCSGIRQWGETITNENGSATIIFPVTYAKYHVEMAIHRGSSNANPVSVAETFYNINSFSLYCENSKTNTALISSLVIWFSIGQ